MSPRRLSFHGSMVLYLLVDDKNARLPPRFTSARNPPYPLGQTQILPSPSTIFKGSPMVSYRTSTIPPTTDSMMKVSSTWKIHSLLLSTCQIQLPDLIDPYWEVVNLWYGTVADDLEWYDHPQITSRYRYQIIARHLQSPTQLHRPLYHRRQPQPHLPLGHAETNPAFRAGTSRCQLPSPALTKNTQRHQANANGYKMGVL
jgi:hypothetical protein